MWNQRRYDAGFRDAHIILGEASDHEFGPAETEAIVRQAYDDLPDDMAVSEYEVGFRDRAAKSGIKLR